MADNFLSFFWIFVWSLPIALWAMFAEAPPARRALFTILGPWAILAFGIAADEGKVSGEGTAATFPWVFRALWPWSVVGFPFLVLALPLHLVRGRRGRS